jgi:polyhydroxyalkanoate synthesis regulator protein
VLDAKSGQDITGIVLAQVILEEEKRAKGSVFPVELLRQLIRVWDPALTEFVTYHLPRLTGIYLESRRALGESLDFAARGEANQGEAVIISQLSAVHKQLRQLLDVLEVEDIE